MFVIYMFQAEWILLGGSVRPGPNGTGRKDSVMNTNIYTEYMKRKYVGNIFFFTVIFKNVSGPFFTADLCRIALAWPSGTKTTFSQNI